MDAASETQPVPEEVPKDEPEDFGALHQIQNRYSANNSSLYYFINGDDCAYRYAFWYRYDSGKGSTNYTNYNQSIKKIASFQSVSFEVSSTTMVILTVIFYRSSDFGIFTTT